MLTNFPAFLKVLDIPHRADCLTYLLNLNLDPKDWRFRELLATQLSEYLPLLPLADINSILVPLAMTLAVDPIQKVRDQATLSIAKTLPLLKPQPSLLFSTISHIISTLCQANTFRHR